MQLQSSRMPSHILSYKHNWSHQDDLFCGISIQNNQLTTWQHYNLAHQVDSDKITSRLLGVIYLPCYVIQFGTHLLQHLCFQIQICWNLKKSFHIVRQEKRRIINEKSPPTTNVYLLFTPLWQCRAKSTNESNVEIQQPIETLVWVLWYCGFLPTGTHKVHVLVHTYPVHVLTYSHTTHVSGFVYSERQCLGILYLNWCFLLAK